MKISSSTHMTILFSFAIVFVGLYLYYTINDVRRMSGELKKVNQDVTSITQELSELRKTNLDVAKIFNMNEMLTKELNGIIASASVCIPKTLEDDDTQSVDTEDIKKMLNDDDAVVEEELDREAATLVVAVVADVADVVSPTS